MARRTSTTWARRRGNERTKEVGGKGGTKVVEKGKEKKAKTVEKEVGPLERDQEALKAERATCALSLGT